MIARQLRTFLWLKWRLTANHWRRAGGLNAAFTMIIVIGVAVLAVPIGAACFYLGLRGFPEADPAHLLYLWDGLVLAFLFFWCVGLVTELQKTDSLRLSQFMHLPVSLPSAFVVNYVSSLTTLTMICFLPILLGFALALAMARGMAFLIAIPLTAAFLLMVTGISYQFQGWLAALMSNPRRRRTVMLLMTFGFIGLTQAPSLIGNYQAGARYQDLKQQLEEFEAQSEALNQQLLAEVISQEQYNERLKALSDRQVQQLEQQRFAQGLVTEQTAKLANQVLPPGWLPLGIMAAAEGSFVPALLGGLGMTLLGAGSLWRAYRTNVRLYQGEFTSGARAVSDAGSAEKHPRSSATPTDKVRPGWLGLETRLPGLSEPVSVIALAGMRSLLRSTEGKLMLMSPVLVSVALGTSMLRWRTASEGSPEASGDAWLAIGAVAVTLFGLMPYLINQFAFDRDGFRVFVLCSARRRDILLGKNLAVLPIFVGMTAIMIAVLQCLRPMSVSHLLAMIPQAGSMFLVYCLLMNLVSILAPVPLAPGSLKPANTQAFPILLQLLTMFVVLPIAMFPTLLPLFAERGQHLLGIGRGVPIFLLLATAVFCLVALLYRFCLGWQGGLLQRREQEMLETITHRGV